VGGHDDALLAAAFRKVLTSPVYVDVDTVARFRYLPAIPTNSVLTYEESEAILRVVGGSKS